MFVVAFARSHWISGWISGCVMIIIVHSSPLPAVRALRLKHFLTEPRCVRRTKEHDVLRKRPNKSFPFKCECPREAGIVGVQQTEDGLITEPLILMFRQIDQIPPCIPNELSVVNHGVVAFDGRPSVVARSTHASRARRAPGAVGREGLADVEDRDCWGGACCCGCAHPGGTMGFLQPFGGSSCSLRSESNPKEHRKVLDP